MLLLNLVLKANIFIAAANYNEKMPAEGIANFDSYAWLAAGFFIVGIFTAMVYEKSSSKIKHFRKQEQQHKRQEVGSSSDIKRD